MSDNEQPAIIHPFLLFAEPHTFLRSPGAARHCYCSSLYLIEAGGGSLAIGNREHPLAPGLLLYIRPWIWHQWRPDPLQSLSLRCVYFDWSFTDRPGLNGRRGLFQMNKPADLPFDACRIGPDAPLDIPEVIPGLDAMKQLRFPFVELASGFDLLDRFDLELSLGKQAQFQRFLLQLLQALQSKEAYSDPRIRKAVRRMEAESASGGSYQAGKWSGELGLSRSHYQTLFKEQTGVSPKQYWNRLRLSRCKEALKQMSLSITEIADLHGFASVHAFSRAFKEQTGETPSAFRRKYTIY